MKNMIDVIGDLKRGQEIHTKQIVATIRAHAK
jgi:hypothetical protein